MQISFTKSRLVYWKNSPTELKDDVTSWAKIKVAVPDAKNANPNIRVATVPGTVHGFHAIPYNNYGCYLNVNEYISLLHNTQSFMPVSATIKIHNTTPISIQAGTGGTSQLSFNNTIYSICPEVYDTPHIRISKNFSGEAIASNFYRSADGTGFSDGKQLVLPNPDIQYLLPLPVSSAITEDQPILTTVATAQAAATTFTPVAANSVQPLTVDELKKIYYPDLLQDNSKVRILYPGENLLEHHVQCESVYNIVDNSSPQFGEPLYNMDQRAGATNTNNIKFNPELWLSTNVFQKLRGPRYHEDFGAIDTEVGYTSARQKEEMAARLQCNYKYNDKFSKIPPLFFIKGLPIYAAGQLLNHEFSGWLTLELTIQAQPRAPYIPRPLQWQFANIQAAVVNENGSKVVRQYMTDSIPSKVMTNDVWTNPKKRLRSSAIIQADTFAKLNNALANSYAYADFDEEDISESRFTYSINNVAPTNTFSNAS